MTRYEIHHSGSTGDTIDSPRTSSQQDTMDTPNASKPRPRKTRTLQDEIAAAAEKLRKLQERQKEIERKALARNQKAISELIASHRLDGTPIEHWRHAIEDIKAALLRQSSRLQGSA